jgi:hypothetical protein
LARSTLTQLFFADGIGPTNLWLPIPGCVFPFVLRKLFFGQRLPARGGCATVSE